MEVPELAPYDKEDWTRESRAYAAMITRMDKGIGRILDQLKDAGLDENTLVIFTSDNGPMPAEEFTDFFDSNGPLEGGKRDLYEGGIRIPFIARWPGKITAGTQSDHISAFWDFLPTACEIAGAEIPKDIDGISYLPTLLGEEQPVHQYLYWEFPEKGYKVALRKGKWKAIRNNMEEDPDGPIELYNLEDDIGEENNVAEANPETTQQLTRLLEEAHSRSERFPMPGEE
jgi:arylsulfatase A-like enzyme